MPGSNPKPDEFGRYRVSDGDTGHELSIHAAALPHGNYTVLSEPASDCAGDALPVKYGAPKSLSSKSTTSGQSPADTTKES